MQGILAPEPPLAATQEATHNLNANYFLFVGGSSNKSSISSTGKLQQLRLLPPIVVRFVTRLVLSEHIE